MSLLLETIRIEDGHLVNAHLHQERAAASSLALFGKAIHLEFDNLLIPDEFLQGVVKCRILYDMKIREITFEKYTPRQIRSLQLVYDDQIDYSHKWEDRSALTALLKQKKAADEVLIVKNGQLSDISYANVVLKIDDKLYTPKNCLLAGTRRQQLLAEGVVEERELTVEDLRRALSVHIVNAMLSLQDGIIVPQNHIYY